MKGLNRAFEDGVKHGKYVWGQIYSPDGQVLASSTTVDDKTLDIDSILGDHATMGPLTVGARSKSDDALIDHVLKQQAEFEGGLDLLLVASRADSLCGKWPSPFHPKNASPVTQAGRSALLRIVAHSDEKVEQMEQIVRGLRKCPASRIGKLAAELEVNLRAETSLYPVPSLIRLGIEEAAKGLLSLTR